MSSPIAPDRLKSLYDATAADYATLVAQDLNIDISRGKPSPEQLDLSMELLSLPDPDDILTGDGMDARNYGGDPLGLRELRDIFAPLMRVSADRLVAGGNSSLSMMHDCLVWALLRGVPGGKQTWINEEKIAFLCPVPGYELHFRMCDAYGIELRPVPVTDDGPDMTAVLTAVADPVVKGMWCVPTHANPTGEIFNTEVVEQLARMKTAAPDFRLFWDEAYLLHHFQEGQKPADDILSAAEGAGHADRPLVFASTSKITFAGSGVGLMAASQANIDWYRDCRVARGPGEDKVNQLRHARFLKSPEHVRRLMQYHAALLAPKFETIDAALQERLAGRSEARWSCPQGGYFISVDAQEGTATRAVALAEEAGVKLTVAGSTWPGGRDPNDSNIRVAPSYTSMKDVKAAADIIAVSILLAELEVGANCGIATSEAVSN